MTAFREWLKLATMSKGYSVCKMVSLDPNFKMAKTFKKRLYNHIRVVLCRKTATKIAKIWKMTAFRKWPKLSTVQRLYLCKMVSLGPILKMAKTCEKGLHNHSVVFLCKKRLQKIINISKMTVLRKWPKLVTTGLYWNWASKYQKHTETTL